jgi:hypothetical protein
MTDLIKLSFRVLDTGAVSIQLQIGSQHIEYLTVDSQVDAFARQLGWNESGALGALDYLRAIEALPGRLTLKAGPIAQSA